MFGGIEAATKIETSYIAAPPRSREHPLERIPRGKRRHGFVSSSTYTPSSCTKLREGGREGGSFLSCVKEGEWVEDGEGVVLALSRTATLLFSPFPVSREFLVESAIKGEFLIIIVRDIYVVILIIAKNLGKMEYLISIQDVICLFEN